ncbi:MFS transporter [Actinomadura sp. DSM 109109]|nr:MFS transporter [Actinomadura lepetitiana]
MTNAGELSTIQTRVPARLDRLPWSRFHWRIVIGLGTVWVLDGLEVTIVGSIAARMTEPGSGIDVSSGDIGTAAAFYVAGACLGALLFGQLTDRFGRKKLFMITLGLYLVATVATAFATEAWYLFLFRFLTGAGIGGEYAAINSAIDELIPARNRGRVDLAINGSYWLGAAIGSLGSVLLLNDALLSADLGWRLAFAIGGVLGLGIMVVRRSVPESPRWLFIHGHAEEAERIVDRIEREVQSDTGEPLPTPGESITVRQRRSISFREIARVTVKRYPNRTVLGLSLFVGQAFMYNAVTFDLGTILSDFFGVASGTVPYFLAAFALGNLVGTQQPPRGQALAEEDIPETLLISELQGLLQGRGRVPVPAEAVGGQRFQEARLQPGPQLRVRSSGGRSDRRLQVAAPQLRARERDRQRGRDARRPRLAGQQSRGRAGVPGIRPQRGFGGGEPVGDVSGRRPARELVVGLAQHLVRSGPGSAGRERPQPDDADQGGEHLVAGAVREIQVSSRLVGFSPFVVRHRQRQMGVSAGRGDLRET